MANLTQTTAYNRAFLLVLSSDHVTGASGVTTSTIIVQGAKNAASFTTLTAVVSELGNGFYNAALKTSDTATLGDLAFHISQATADPTDFVDQVVAAATGASSTSVTVVGYAAGQDPASLVLDVANGIEGGVTPRQALRYMAAALAGQLAGAGGTTITINGIGQTSGTRISATVDSNGDRTAVTLS